MPDVFTLLDEIRRRPTMYVGGDEQDRSGQLASIETLLYGYSLAVELHGIDDPGRDFVKAFATYLHDRFGWSTALGPAVAVIDGTAHDSDPLERCWLLIDDFRQHLASSKQNRT